MRTEEYIKKYCITEGDTIYSLNGHAYIGLRRKIGYAVLLKYLARHEITEIYSFHDLRKTSESRVACCGFSKKEQRWYGWTHRGIRSFGIGDTYFNYLGGKPAKTLDECKKLAFYAVQELN